MFEKEKVKNCITDKLNRSVEVLKKSNAELAAGVKKLKDLIKDAKKKGE